MTVSESSPIQVRTAGLTWQQVDDEVVILNMDTSRYLSLNQSAVSLWKALQTGPTTVGALAHVLIEEFEVEEERARHDAGAFVAQCAAFGLLE